MKVWQEFFCNDCFSGETEFLTENGVQTLGDSCDQPVRVLGKSAGWTDAYIRSFGRQNIVEIVIGRYGQEKTIATTAGHGWFLRKDKSTTRLPIKTTDLVPGQWLYSMYPRMPDTVRPSAFGIAAGIVFGDGTRRPADWQVLEVAPTSRTEEVYCAVVPHGHIFTLDQNIVTSNCNGYFRAKLDMALNIRVNVVCPNCGHHHPRCVKDGRIVEHADIPGSHREDIICPKSTYSKQPFTTKIKPNARDGAVISAADHIRDQMMRDLWLERFGGG